MGKETKSWTRFRKRKDVLEQYARARHMEFLTYSQDWKIKPGMNFSTR